MVYKTNRKLRREIHLGKESACFAFPRFLVRAVVSIRQLPAADMCSYRYLRKMCSIPEPSLGLFVFSWRRFYLPSPSAPVLLQSFGSSRAGHDSATDGRQHEPSSTRRTGELQTECLLHTGVEGGHFLSWSESVFCSYRRCQRPQRCLVHGNSLIDNGLNPSGAWT